MTDTELLELSGIAIRHGVLNVYEGRSDADMQRLVDKMLNDPAAYYTVAPLYPVLRIYAELRERVAAKSCGSAIQAVKRLIRTCARNDMRGVWKSADGSAWCCCDGQREVRLKNVSGVPVLEQSFPNLEAQIDGCAKAASKSLRLPTAAELKTYIAAEKSAGVKPDSPWYWWGSDTPAVNASFLLDMVTIFPDCKEARYRTELSPLYFCGDNGDGILLPVRRAKCPEFESRWNELHKSAG